MSSLNPSQAKGAAARRPRTIILAGAGTGKTTTGTHWASSLIAEGVPRSQIVMLTFTRKAAEVMRSRVRTLSPVAPGSGDVFAGTYHSFASRLIRSNAAGFGLKEKAFSVIDDDDSLSLMRYAYKQVSSPPEELKPGEAKRLLSYLTNIQAPLDEAIKERFGPDEGRAVRNVFARFKKIKAASSAVDYDDLLTMLLDRLRDDADFAEKLRRRFRYVLVDEFQDNNLLNFAILSAWNPEHLVVVGDRQQSIYRFRGASPDLVDQFAKENPGVEIIALESNYRSGPALLSLANEIVKDEAYALTLTAAPGAESQIKTLQFDAPYDQAAHIANGIEARISGGARADEIAVLARSSRHLRPVEFELKRLRIPYRQYGGIGITDAAVVKDFLAVLRFAANPRDKTAAIRAMCLLPGVGKKSAEASAQIEAEDEETVIVPTKARDLVRWAEIVNTSSDLGEAGDRLLKVLGPVIIANHHKADTSKSVTEDRHDDLNALVEFMHQEAGKPLADFLEIFTLDRGNEKPHPEGHITLSTIHSAKGLEWDVVYIVGAEKGSMPHPRAYSDEDVSEERRLMYVAITRARKDLAICAAAADDGVFIPSPLLPRHLIWEQPAGTSRASESTWAAKAKANLAARRASLALNQ